jgi:flagellin
MLSIQTNVNSMNAQENLRVTNQFQGRTIARLTSGYRINESGDDAAGLAVANMYRSDVSELQQGVRNANDGLSTLQIIDGGLNNVSKMLDRLKTLATQSASATFTGDRTTLNKEYQDLLGEINRQAGMVGLASTGSKEVRNNVDIGVYVGGSKQGSAKVSIELSGASNRVDSTGLNLVGSTIADGGATVVGDLDLRGKTDLLKASAAGTPGKQVFTFQEASGAAPTTFTVTVTGSDSGITTDDVLSQLNNALGSHGINASIDSTTGKLAFGGTEEFTVSVAAATGTVAGKELSSAVANPVANGSMYQTTSSGTFGLGENITFTVGNTTATVALLAGDTTAAGVATKINTAANALGISAFVSGSNVILQSKNAFSAVTDDGTTNNTTGFWSAASASHTAATVTSATSTSNAESAITSIQKAVSALGLVQGKVGTAQNKLSYAIQLAQSQITSFSAAESRIRDADVAAEAANLTKAQVLQQASLAALAQANSAPQAVLSLLRG